MSLFSQAYYYTNYPTPAVINCAFSGFPLPEVKILKNGVLLAQSKESVSHSVTVDGEDDFGVYVCMGENGVKSSSTNYTFEIKPAGKQMILSKRPSIR